MSSVLERRREFLKIMRQLTLDKGYFTINDIADLAGLPRSTVQDWINRLIEERCLVQKEEKRGRTPARYVASSAMLSTACRRIFTTVDGDMVAIFHECRSGGCAAFCAFHHRQAGGVLSDVSRDGMLLHEYATIGKKGADIGLYPSAAVGVIGVRKDNGYIVQRIRCTGGPAYSLTDMMAMAEGVVHISVEKTGHVVEGDVVTRALTHIIIGIDDTDSPEGGATFALALGLLQFLGKMEGIIPIGHRVAMLDPSCSYRTAGNSCSYIELAAEPGLLSQIRETAVRFVADESLSPEWGIAIRRGFTISPALRAFGLKARESSVSREEAEAVAQSSGVDLEGNRGIIGALAAVGLRGLPHEVLLDPARNPETTPRSEGNN
ncbi:MAG: sugar-specific transcriptional regulator TrmB [Methanomicrobiaceae archaeon]|nr:sugar-specific transcriptional regulator TrmB [Methanomicrobiaceae archaeon]